MEIYLNSNYKKTAEKLTSLNFLPTNNEITKSNAVGNEDASSSSRLIDNQNVPPTSRQVGDVVIVKYVIRKKSLHYADVIQNISGHEFMTRFLKRS